MVILYGIANCDTVKKARTWLEERGIEYQFHDFRKQGLNPVQLHAWVDEWGWEALINRKGTTWRKLPEETRQAMNETLALAVMEDQPSLIKRPILDNGQRRLVGFDPNSYRQLFQH
jgi:Spx/MgsR family transcriptional regulator